MVLPGRWTVRFALVLGASAELVKARFLLLPAGAQGEGGGSWEVGGVRAAVAGG